MVWNPAPEVLADLLVLPGWSHGFCPVHACEMTRCSAACLQQRKEFAIAARELVAEWPAWRRRMLIKHGRGMLESAA